MRRIVFYSWQSDLPNSTNRGFIQRALEGATKKIATDDSVAVEPVVDRDTSGVPGSPDIATTIFSKISVADVVVVDVSIINQDRGGRLTPNPNVLIELGYALKSLGYERVILVFNEAYGKIANLPFDLKMRRLIVYSMPEVKEDRATERKKLQNELELAIRSSLIETPTNIPVSGDELSVNNIVLADWFGRNEEIATKGISSLKVKTFMEVRSYLLASSLKRSGNELKDAARASQIRTFGWPIGIYSDTNDNYRPKPDKNGIHAELSIQSPEGGGQVSYDYWAINQNGSFYLLKSIFEDQRKPGFIFFNTRIVQIAESLMYLSNLYKKLSVDEMQEFSVEIRHSGLQGRIMGAAGSRFIHERKTEENESAVIVTTSIKQIDEHLSDLVKEFTGPLFEIFDFFSVDDNIVDDIVEKYRNGQVT